jgi:hypothetical protein
MNENPLNLLIGKVDALDKAVTTLMSVLPPDRAAAAAALLDDARAEAMRRDTEDGVPEARSRARDAALQIWLRWLEARSASD